MSIQNLCKRRGAIAVENKPAANDEQGSSDLLALVSIHKTLPPGDIRCVCLVNHHNLNGTRTKCMTNASSLEVSNASLLLMGKLFHYP